MRIKRVEIIGFKSFCDRTVVHIDAPVNAIVGPNGCGKSNIVDAIRWCMGEQSAKHLRGKAMEDVIFAGSENRGPAPMAEVSLTFDDVGFSQEKLELAMHSDELAVERALDEVAPVVGGELAADGEPGEAGAIGDGEAGAMAAGADSGAEIAPVEAAPPETAAVEAAPVADAAVADAAPVLGPDGEPVVSVSDEVREMLADRPPVLDFARYTEVTITRRLYRDGTSQYFINKTPCRLRDVTDFFLGTGIGTKAYAIIEQGRIGQIVSSRPQDRRAIIEEAAGITKFKSKKKAAEKKLEQTKQNLLRVSDIVTELEKRMGTLRRQAQKAERYRKYKTELRDIELWKASHRLLELWGEDRLARGRLVEAGAELGQVRTDLTEKDALVVAERADLAVEERRLSTLQEALYDLDNRIRLAESKMGFQGREAEELDQRVAQAETEIEDLRRQRTEAADRLAIEEGELARLADDVNREDDEVAVRDATAAEARQMLANAQSRLDEARAQLAATRTEIAKGEAQRDALVRRREEAERRLGRVVEEVETASERARELERETRRVAEALAQLKQTRLDLGAETAGFESRRELLTEQVSQGEAEVETLRTELHRRRSRLQSLTEIQERYEGFARGTRAVMQKSGEIGARASGRIEGLVADVVRAPEQLEIAVEAALGDRLGGILVDHAHVGVAAIDYLKRSGAGRSAFVASRDAAPVRASDSDAAPAASAWASDGGWDTASGGGIVVEDRIVVDDQRQLHAAHAAIGGEGVLGRMVDLVQFADGYQNVGHSLLGGCVVVDSLDRAVRLHAEGVPSTLVTLDGDIVDERGVVSGGSRDAQGAGVLAQKREIRDLGEIVGSLEIDLTDATARLVSAKTELKQVTMAIEGLKTQAHQGDIAIMGHDKDLGRLRGEHDRLKDRLGQLGTEQLELEERLQSITTDEASLGMRRIEAEARIDTLEKEQLGYIEDVTGGRERLDELAQALTEARVRAAQLGEKRASLEASALRLEQATRSLAGRIERLTADREEGAARATELRRDSAQLADELGGLRERRTATGSELDDGKQRYDVRVTEVNAAEIMVRELRGRNDRLSTEVAQLEIKVAHVEDASRHLHETMAERYQVDLPRIVSEYHLRPVAGDNEDARAKELRDLIDRMGSDINLTAIEEFQEVSQRFEFLSAQKADLEHATDQLDKAIDKINKTSRKLFKDTFTAVNDTFKAVFPRLFRGGQAYLSLTGGDDVDLLEAGVEIMAQPPGKKNSTVEQLSGGEKALTAVALVFSIFLIKPSPFCILDEVDAPLDEANVDRYNEIVREMTDRSQFIVISHNKRTMESADNLYGVTMQEPGVSKLVSVNLSKIGQAHSQSQSSAA
jgi:chromosome segregation protein